MGMEITTKGAEMKVEQAEQAYEELAEQIETTNWGEEQSKRLERLASELQRAYDEAGTPEADRIIL